MKLKSLTITLLFIITFSLTACENNLSSKDKTDYDMNNKTVSSKIDTEIDSKIELPKSEPKKITPNILKLGSLGENVLLLQNKLNEFGYNLTLDGNFGQQTLNAVFDFQNRNNIALSEIVNEETISKLYMSPTKETIYNPKDVIYNIDSKANKAEKFINNKVSNSPTQYYIWVNTNNPKVYIFKGYNRQWKLLKEIACTVGKPSTPTIKGTFNVGIKGNSFVVKDNPSLKCDYYTQISGNYLFHTVLLYRNGEIADGRLGLKLSHGCIRLSISDTKYIYDSIPESTSVYIS